MSCRTKISSPDPHKVAYASRLHFQIPILSSMLHPTRWLARLSAFDAFTSVFLSLIFPLTHPREPRRCHNLPGFRPKQASIHFQAGGRWVLHAQGVPCAFACQIWVDGILPLPTFSPIGPSVFDRIALCGLWSCGTVCGLLGGTPFGSKACETA